MNPVTLDQVIDSAMQLPDDQREMLVSILTKRQIEARRHEIAEDAQASITDYRMKKFRATSAEAAIRELQQNYMVLHRSTCPRINTYAGRALPGGFTERSYVKICSTNLDSLRGWVQRHGRKDGSFSDECGCVVAE